MRHKKIELRNNWGDWMGLYTIFGINGIGKDTVATEK